MRFKALGIQNNVVSVYDKTKTTILGNVAQRSVNGKSVLAPPLTTVTDVYTDTGSTLTPATNALYTSPNGRHLVASVAAGQIIIALYNYNWATRTHGPLVGRIQVNTPNAAATVHTIHSLCIYNDAGATGWKIVIGTTGSVLINGGPFVVNNVALADFTNTPTVFGLAIANNAKAVYQYQDSTQMGAAQTTTGLCVLNGGDIDQAAGIFYAQVGLLANSQMYGFDLTVAPNVTSLHTVQSQTTLWAGTSPSAFFKTPDATTPMVANDPVVITANAPTGFTATTATAQTVYFARDIQTVGGLVYFNLSATSNGVAITPGSNTSGVTLIRANGQSATGYLPAKKSGIGLTGIAGVIVTTNSQQVVACTDGSNAGFNCYFLPTSTGLYLFRLSDIGAGVTTFTSMDTRNILNTAVTAPTLVNAVYMPGINADGTGVFIYMMATSSFVMKAWANNQITYLFGGQDTATLEQSVAPSVGFGLTAVAAICERNGMLFVSGSTAGQRIILALDIQADVACGTSFVISPVFSTPGQLLKFIQTYEVYFDFTDSMAFQLRGATTQGDAGFNAAAGGWGAILPNNEDLTAVALQPWTQLRIGFYTATLFANSPAQPSEVLLGYDQLIDNSDQWAGVNDGTTQGATSPSDAVFRLQTAYASVVPQLFQRDVDRDTQVTVATLNTVSNPTNFNYSTDGGTTWLPLGTIPNVVGTLVRVRRSLPGGTNAFVSLKES